MSRGAQRASNGIFREGRSDFPRRDHGMSLKGEHNRDFAARGISHFPSDWPGPGPVDRMIHDLPHHSSVLEWWYVFGHLRTEAGQELSLFSFFSRMARGINKATGEIEYYHVVTWSLSDTKGDFRHTDSLVDRQTPEVGLDWIKKGKITQDSRINRAMAEVLERGHVPRPDRVPTRNICVDEKSLRLDFGDVLFEGADRDGYHLHLFDPRKNIGCDLSFYPQKQPVRHAKDGVQSIYEGEEMFYYFIPRLRIDGNVTLNGKRLPVSGSGWYDRQFGKAQPTSETAWNWTGVQLDDGSDITAYSVHRKDTGALLDRCLVVVDSKGHRTFLPSFKFEPVRWWRSTRTFLEYPIGWHLKETGNGIDLTIEARFADQEHLTCIARSPCWEGCCTVSGKIRGREARGYAWVERIGFMSINSVEEFFKAVSEEAQKSINEIIPHNPSFEQIRDLIASAERPHYLDGVDIKQIARTIIKPVREITDRRGKSWRSYATLVCCDIVGGDSRKFLQWLAMPELIHVGSLIVDDVEDKSTIRRGGPACHLLYGEPLAINAGNAIYFLAQKLLISSKELSDAQKLRIYDLYFEAMRAGHAGQAIDIDGMEKIVSKAVESGDSAELEKRILACDRLKTAVPVASLARMGAVAGGGTEEQIEALGNYFESLGIAFQIIDDVLDLRGFEKNLKEKGEDIRKRKFTLPLAKALSKLPLEERRWVWKMVQPSPPKQRAVSAVASKLEACGVFDDCIKEASQLVESAWKDVNQKIEDSLFKILLRATSWYLLERKH